ncbi:DUF429 domain-containing protein [Microbacterium sp. 10M-3C3]|uniref:DUF429 domain-containing protein n=1 Tax=Microbacterium sp. 10M-3C3 TaxID=2483401 RepID=UPI000F632CDB|nr:DUF429 domain-containing protein [Microbacterium sp. 10M-3C3]
MITVGVDLAAADAGTAVATISWAGGVARVESLVLGASDAGVVAAASGADRVGIDFALGWPDAFVAFVSAHAEGDVAPDGGGDWRRMLAYRETDRAVRARTGRWPLSVSTDRLGLTALRCAGLLGRLAATGLDVDRTGGGDIAEVYPGASLRLWGFDTTRYRVDPDARGALLAALRAEAPWLDLGGHDALTIRSGDAFDAVVAALAARAVALGRTTPPDAAQLRRARREGWVHLPAAGLAGLVS